MKGKDVRNYWGASPLGGKYNPGGNNKPSASNINSFLAPLIIPMPKQDPSTWKESRREAEIPLPLLSYRYRMQQMFMDTVQDGHTYACIERRKDQVLLKDFGIFNSKGEENIEASETIRQVWFKNIMSYCLDSTYYGFTLLGLGNIVDGKPQAVNLLRRTNVSPDRLNIAFTPYSPSGIEFMNKDAVDDYGNSFYDWTIWVPTPSDFGISPCGYGLLYKVALYQILLRNNLGDNSTYNELFGQPLRVGKTDKKDPLSRNNLAEALDMMGSQAWALLDPEDKIEILSSGSSSGSKDGPYDNFEQRLQKIISKIILGHSDAMDSTPGKLGAAGGEGDPVAQGLMDKEKKDTDSLETIINDTVIPKLLKLGIKIPIGEKFKFKNDKEKQQVADNKNKNTTAVAMFVKTFSDGGYEVDPIQIEEMTGIKLTKKEIATPATTELQGDKMLSEKVQNRLKEIYNS
jgi:phage gp29-like protein